MEHWEGKVYLHALAAGESHMVAARTKGDFVTTQYLRVLSQGPIQVQGRFSKLPRFSDADLQDSILGLIDSRKDPESRYARYGVLGGLASVNQGDGLHYSTSTAS
jgi:hypothetical protein